MTVTVGQKAEISRRIEQADIEAFAKLVGDNNPVHLDADFAAGTRFGRPIAHGMWAGSLFSAVIGTSLPGPGSIYVSQTMKFRAPIYPGDTITATVEVTAVREDKPIVTLATTCSNQQGEILVTGEAVVLLESR